MIGLQERAKEEQSLQDNNFYYADASDGNTGFSLN